MYRLFVFIYIYFRVYTTTLLDQLSGFTKETATRCWTSGFPSSGRIKAWLTHPCVDYWIVFSGSMMITDSLWIMKECQRNTSKLLLLDCLSSFQSVTSSSTLTQTSNWKSILWRGLEQHSKQYHCTFQFWNLEVMECRLQETRLWVSSLNDLPGRQHHCRSKSIVIPWKHEETVPQKFLESRGMYDQWPQPGQVHPQFDRSQKLESLSPGPWNKVDKPMLQPRLVDFAWKPLCSAMFHPSICRTNSTQSFPRLLPTILRLKTRSSFGKVQLPEKGPLCCQDKDVSAAKKNTKKLATLENLNKHPRTHPNLSTDVLKSLRSFPITWTTQ